jgi:SnoaL-like domain
MATHEKELHVKRVGLIESLADRVEITDLVSRLTAGLDEHRFDDLLALFVEDAVALTPGGRSEGREAVVAQATRNHRDYDRLQHLITGVLIDLDGDRATVRANVVGVFGRSTEDGPARALGGVYRFELIRSEQGWLFTSVEVRPVWHTGEAPIPVPA